MSLTVENMKTQKRSLFVKTVLAVLVITGGVFMTGCTNGSDGSASDMDSKIAEYLKQIPINLTDQEKREFEDFCTSFEFQYKDKEHDKRFLGCWGRNEEAYHNNYLIFYDNGLFLLVDAGKRDIDECDEWYTEMKDDKLYLCIAGNDKGVATIGEIEITNIDNTSFTMKDNDKTGTLVRK